MNDRWLVCDTHEIPYPRNGGFCKDCRIEQLEAELEQARQERKNTEKLLEYALREYADELLEEMGDKRGVEGHGSG